jgi:hypothetical protein
MTKIQIMSMTIPMNRFSVEIIVPVPWSVKTSAKSVLRELPSMICRASNPTAQQVDDALQFGNHPSGGRSAFDQFFGLSRGQTRKLSLRLTRTQVNPIDIGKQDQFFCLQLHSYLGSNCVRVDVEDFPFSVGPQRRNHREVTVVEQNREQARIDLQNVADMPKVHPRAFAGGPIHNLPGRTPFGVNNVSVYARKTDRMHSSVTQRSENVGD